MRTIAATIRPSPLEGWIARRLALSGSDLTREIIQRHQLRALKETLRWARARSSFYAARLASLDVDTPRSLEQFSQLPFTGAEDVMQRAPELLCVSQSEIRRVVTLTSSGTTGAPKRIFFSASDQELALDFFAHGVAAVAAPGDRMLIALPGDREGSVGDQLAQGIARAGVVPLPHGFVFDPVQTLARMDRAQVTCIIGLPVQMLALATNDHARGGTAFRRLRSVVLCSDHVPESLMRTLRQSSCAAVFEHYGMTEMGLGGGVDCAAHAGYHLREADLYFEIVDPDTGDSLPDGELGEIVFTTLNRTAMPLIRYRTGDLSRFLPGRCACGTILRRLERVRGRLDGSFDVGAGGTVNMAMLDDALFAIPELMDFTAAISGPSPRCLQLRIYAPHVAASLLEFMLRKAVNAIPSLRQSCQIGELHIETFRVSEPFPVTGAKRRIEMAPSPENVVPPSAPQAADALPDVLTAHR
jgi:phenylacetate-coenzyme A ligase PaaK-like adenylate-forming protein